MFVFEKSTSGHIVSQRMTSVRCARPPLIPAMSGCPSLWEQRARDVTSKARSATPTSPVTISSPNIHSSPKQQNHAHLDLNSNYALQSWGPFHQHQPFRLCCILRDGQYIYLGLIKTIMFSKAEKVYTRSITWREWLLTDLQMLNGAVSSGMELHLRDDVELKRTFLCAIYILAPTPVVSRLIGITQLHNFIFSFCRCLWTFRGRPVDHRRSYVFWKQNNLVPKKTDSDDST